MRAQIYQIHRIPEFRNWYETQTEKAKVQIDDRLSKIQEDGYFGDHKCVNDDPDGVWELKWKNGRRVYYAHIPYNKLLVLLGGNKNGQDKDIRKADLFLKRYTA